MGILKNKHVVIAMLVAPILALISYFAVDAIVSEKPHAAKPGDRYALVEKPNCRYSSGQCGLKNGDFEVTLTTEWRDADRMLLMLKSVAPLEGALVALVEPGDVNSDAEQPLEMAPEGSDGLRWSLELPRPDPESDRLRVVVSSNQTLYYGDAAMKFTLYKTTFGEDFRQE
ncbi:hypothetical protein KOI40_00655 [Aestuariicella sp. G3-2]|uniref:hypothetical protein n=1 Tax=Pseudomaricurvus albidus TaxID=2842452 RepID=UPI001C0B3224|nr:hypothetical protein [Aestuariicella albida]MBU3068302.1 hypothetical protein [Aestuariicella albida]